MQLSGAAFPQKTQGTQGIGLHPPFSYARAGLDLIKTKRFAIVSQPSPGCLCLRFIK
jgi:hypothetical protein